MTDPATPAGWYPDPGGSDAERYWDGTVWTGHCRPFPSKPRKLRWVWVAAAGAVVLVTVLGVIAWRVSTSSDADRWTAFPRTIACHVAPRADGPRWVDVPPSLLAKQVSMTHPGGGQRLRLEITFAQLTPQAAGLSYGILVQPASPRGSDAPVLTINSPQGGQSWKADASTLDHPERNPLISVASTMNTATIDVDLEGQTKLLGNHFTPSVDILISPPGATAPDFDVQTCDWSMPVAESEHQTPTSPTVHAPPPAVSTSQAARPPGTTTSCGPDAASALQSALSQLGPEPVTGRGWETTPIASNYDACADLSTMLVMVEGGTGSSPVQALMFHRGTYLGTGTTKAYGFTSLNSAASTTDTVVLSYRDRAR